MEKFKNLKTGYYWVEIHPIFEESATIGYFNSKSKTWYLHNLLGDQSDIIEKIIEPVFIQKPYAH